MPVIFLVVGILVTGAGLATLGFGIPINDLAIGQMLILAGTTGFCAGLLLLGLAGVMSQLAQVAAALKAPPMRVAARAAEAPARVEIPTPVPEMPQARAEPQLPLTEPQMQRAEPPPRPPVTRPTDVPPPEPRPAGQPAVDVSASAIERLRSSLPRPERVVPEAEAAPLSPNGESQHGAPRAPPPPPEVRPVEAPPIAATPPATGPAQTVSRLDFLFRSRQTRAGQPSESFDAVWPQRQSRQGEPKPGDKPGSTAAIAPSEPPSRPEPVAAPSAESRQPAILKSGVVDGMAYTLYVDGSIEAQLPQGTVRFGSIVELREHIENNS
jgi:hypothetical protein